MKRHDFSEEICEQIKPLFVGNNYRGLISVLSDWIVINFTIYVCVQLTKSRVAFGVAFYLVTVAIVGGRMRALANLLHCSSHRCLAKAKLLNDLLGSVFSGWCVLQSWSSYHDNHVRRHHPHLGNPDKDPDYQEWIKSGLYASDVTKRDVLTYLKNIPSPNSTLKYLHYTVKDRIFASNENVFERTARFCFWAIILFVLYKTNNLCNFFLFWTVPLITTSNWIGNLVELLEHYPLLNKNFTDPIYLSRNRLCYWFEDFFFGPHADGYHLVHHLFPRIPHWNLHRAHAILMTDETYAILHNRSIGIRPIVTDILSYFE